MKKPCNAGLFAANWAYAFGGGCRLTGVDEAPLPGAGVRFIGSAPAGGGRGASGDGMPELWTSAAIFSVVSEAIFCAVSTAVFGSDCAASCAVSVVTVDGAAPVSVPDAWALMASAVGSGSEAAGALSAPPSCQTASPNKVAAASASISCVLFIIFPICCFYSLWEAYGHWHTLSMDIVFKI